MWDAKFHVFQELNRLLDKFIPEVKQFTPEQVDAVHAFAKKIAADLLSGEYK